MEFTKGDLAETKLGTNSSNNHRGFLGHVTPSFLLQIYVPQVTYLLCFYHFFPEVFRILLAI